MRAGQLKKGARGLITAKGWQVLISEVFSAGYLPPKSLHFNFKSLPHIFIHDIVSEFGNACCCCCVQSRKLQFSAPTSKFGKVHASPFSLSLKSLLYINHLTLLHGMTNISLLLPQSQWWWDNSVIFWSFQTTRQLWANVKKVTGQLAIFKLYFLNGMQVLADQVVIRWYNEAKVIRWYNEAKVQRSLGGWWWTGGVPMSVPNEEGEG